jgi:tRNA threonylcarbamoyladenosine biosynthesis protein TsaB
MSVIVHIDTALDQAYAGISKEGVLLASAGSDMRDGHAAWLHITIKRLMNDVQIGWTDVTAVSVNSGPGSYTGLRVGMAAAKGFCYATGKPLIKISCTELIALAAQHIPAGFYCPMIDARRMEVFTALYDASLKEITAPAAKVLDENSFSGILMNGKIVFCGKGSRKFNDICNNHNAIFAETDYDIHHHAQIAFKLLKNNVFADTAYALPDYGKPFYSNALSKKG